MMHILRNESKVAISFAERMTLVNEEKCINPIYSGERKLSQAQLNNKQDLKPFLLERHFRRIQSGGC